MATTIGWTPELEERLKAKLEEDYEQADRMIVWASRAEKPLKEGGIINAKGSAESMIKFIKKELGV